MKLILLFKEPNYVIFRLKMYCFFYPSNIINFHHALSQISYHIFLPLFRAIYTKSKIFTRKQITETDIVICSFKKINLP
jgi:hypothetical protein